MSYSSNGSGIAVLHKYAGNYGTAIMRNLTVDRIHSAAMLNGTITVKSVALS